MRVLLDSGVLGLVTNPKRSPEVVACNRWIDALETAGHRVFVPEIIDYEVRRELNRGHKTLGLEHLDQFKLDYAFLPLDSATMLKASTFWAEARWRGTPTASDPALDIDVILAAQAWRLGNEGEYTVIATLNKKHLAQFVPAEHWKDIHPG